MSGESQNDKPINIATERWMREKLPETIGDAMDHAGSLRTNLLNAASDLVYKAKQGLDQEPHGSRVVSDSIYKAAMLQAAAKEIELEMQKTDTALTAMQDSSNNETRAAAKAAMESLNAKVTDVLSRKLLP